MPADLAVIGLEGPDGLPLAKAASAAGLRVIGYDPDPRTADAVNTGRPQRAAGLSAADVRRLRAGGFRATGDPAVLGRVRTAVLCVPVPLARDGTPDLTAVEEAGRAVGARLRPHTTVVLESAVPPGTTEHVLRPLLESGGLRAGRDFHLAHSPSRADPGDPRHTLAGTPKVVGGLTPACAEAAAAFYGRFVERVVRARGPREAETVKLLETAYRHVNAALANEMAVFCHDIGVDVWDVIRCAETRPSGFQAFRPGPDVGGPGPSPRARVPGRPLRLVELAQEVNAGMPRYVVRRAALLLNEHGKSLRGAQVLLLGVSRPSGAADDEHAPAQEIAARLAGLGARITYHDPYAERWRVRGRQVPRAGSLWETVAEADLAVLLAHHGAYDLHGLAAKAQLLLDTRGATPAGAAARL